MRLRLYRLQELFGVPAALLCAVLLSFLYEFTGHNLIGVLFGSVNGSLWESLKPPLLSFVLYSGVELLCVKPDFRRVIPAKTAGVCAVRIMFMLSAESFAVYPDIHNTAASAVSLCSGFVFSAVLYGSRLYLRRYFVPACLTLLLIFLCYFPFTAFPPALGIFIDPETGMYGIIPESFDAGACVL